MAIERLKVGEPLPEFSLPRIDGEAGEFTSQKILGKPSVVLFWRPRQPLSLSAIDDLRSISQTIGSERFTIVSVDAARSTEEEVRLALSETSTSFPILLDPKRELYGKVGVIVAPTTLVLDAKGILRFVLASHPRSYRRIIGARLRFLLGDIGEEAMEKEIRPTVLKIDQDLAAAWRMYNLGRKLQAEGKSKEAFSIFEQAVSRSPSLSEARCTLGFMKFSEGDLESADRHFQTALAHSPSSALARLGKAVVLARQGQSEKAEALLLAILGQRSIAARVRYELGRIYQERGDAERAVTFYQDALAVIFPEPPTAAKAVPATHPPSPPSDVPERTAETVSVRPVEPPAGAKYTGVKNCKKCHFQQWKSWKDTKMAAAFELLKPNVRADVKTARNLDPRKDYTSDSMCLPCHTTGYGFEGGYPESPPGNAREASAAEDLASVVCEACHGPGEGYSSVHKDIQDKKRKYRFRELRDAGQYEIGESVCAACHNWKGPCIARGTTFDFAVRKDQGTHKHYELQYRMDE